MSRDQPGGANGPGKLIQDDPCWWYQGHGVTAATRRMRLYEMPDGRLAAVVTESGDGTSITNAAETVIAQIQAEHPGRQVDVVEHYPASRLAGESFDLVQLDHTGQPRWTRIPATGVRDMLGPGVFANGSGPTPAITSDHDEQWYLEAQGGAMDGRRIHLDVDPDPPVGATTSTVDQDAMRVANRYAGQVEKHDTLIGRARACRDATDQYRRDARDNQESAENHRMAARTIRDADVAAAHARAAREAEAEAAREILAARYYEAQAERYEAQARGI